MVFFVFLFFFYPKSICNSSWTKYASGCYSVLHHNIIMSNVSVNASSRMYEWIFFLKSQVGGWKPDECQRSDATRQIVSLEKTLSMLTYTDVFINLFQFFFSFSFFLVVFRITVLCKNVTPHTWNHNFSLLCRVENESSLCITSFTKTICSICKDYLLLKANVTCASRTL